VDSAGPAGEAVALFFGPYQVVPVFFLEKHFSSGAYRARVCVATAARFSAFSQFCRRQLLLFAPQDIHAPDRRLGAWGQMPAVVAGSLPRLPAGAEAFPPGREARPVRGAQWAMGRETCSATGCAIHKAGSAPGSTSTHGGRYQLEAYGAHDLDCSPPSDAVDAQTRKKHPLTGTGNDKCPRIDLL